MGYFDDPKHRAQWEKELSALREEKARLKAGGQPVSDEAQPSVQMEAEKHFAERTAEQEINPVYEDVYTPEPENEPVHEEVYTPEPENEPVYEEAELTEEPIMSAEPPKKTPEKPHTQRVRPDGIYRERITFQELLRQENMEPRIKLTQRPHVAERTKEVAHEL